MSLLFILLFFSLLVTGCKEDTVKRETTQGRIQRKSKEMTLIAPPMKNPAPKYPWDKTGHLNLPFITKEYFRCKGSPLNPEKSIEKNSKTEVLTDCEGSKSHSLPLDDGREFVYDILITLLNYIQEKTGKRVVITSGHRCPQHNAYVDSSPSNQYSKHMMAAEVSFFVQGLEWYPEQIVERIFTYYREDSPKGQDPEYRLFQRYSKKDTNVSTKPWYNKEVFVKLFSEKEGRNFDNRHPFPYISLQVRYDTKKNARLTYSFEKANNNFLRH